MKKYVALSGSIKTTISCFYQAVKSNSYINLLFLLSLFGDEMLFFRRNYLQCK
jgi:hypothetical protein